MSCEKCGCETAFMGVPHANICECSRCRKVAELQEELADTVTECLAAKSNEDIMRKQLAELRRENKYMRIFLERQAKGIPCPDTATSILSALQEKGNE